MGAHQGGYRIPISREKTGHIPGSRENVSIFPIKNIPPRNPAEYLVFDWKPSPKQWQLRISIEKLHNDII